MPVYNYRELSDVELTTLINERDSQAFAEIFDRYWGVLYVHAMKMLRDEDEVKDVLQELFATLWKNSERLHLTNSLSAYLYTAVRNKIFDLIEHQKVKKEYAGHIAAFISSGISTTDEQIRIRELQHLIEKEISELPPKMREVFELSRKYYLSHKQIADKLGVSDKTVRKQINNAIKILRLKLNVPAITLFFLLFEH